MRKRNVQKMGHEGSGMNQSKLIAIMAFIIVVLAAVMVYSFALKPAFNGYVTEKQNEAQYVVLNALLSQLQQNGYIQIPMGEDEILTLVEYQPSEPQPQEIVE